MKTLPISQISYIPPEEADSEITERFEVDSYLQELLPGEQLVR